MTTFTMPDLGEGLQEAEIVTWHVETGERVVADQPLVSVETDKAVVEVPAPVSGTITRLHAEIGDVVAVGARLVDFDTDEKRQDSGVIVGKLETETTPIAEDVPVTARQAGVAPSSRVHAAPAVRAHARALGIDVECIAGTGPGGSVTVADIAGADGAVKSPAIGTSPGFEGGERLRGVRRAMARTMEKSHAEIVPANVMDDVDIDHWPVGEDVTVRLVRSIGAASAAEPALNVWYDKASDSRLVHERVDLGIAVHTDDGLFVPVFRDVGHRSADDLRAGLARMKNDVRNRSIPPDELKGATITLSNFGVFGAGRYAEMVIVPPQVSIVGAGRIEARVVAIDGAPAIRRMLPLSLTFDHRAVNGGEAARFLAAMIADLGK